MVVVELCFGLEFTTASVVIEQDAFRSRQTPVRSVCLRWNCVAEALPAAMPCPARIIAYVIKLVRA